MLPRIIKKLNVQMIEVKPRKKKAMETIQKNNDCNDKVNILIYDYLCSVN